VYVRCKTKFRGERSHLNAGYASMIRVNEPPRLRYLVTLAIYANLLRDAFSDRAKVHQCAQRNMPNIHSASTVINNARKSGRRP